MAYQTPQLPPERQKIDIPPGVAFKAGFFGFWGAFMAMLILYAVLGVILLVLGVGIASMTEF